MKKPSPTTRAPATANPLTWSSTTSSTTSRSSRSAWLCQEPYCGEWNSEEDFARHIVDEGYNLEREMGDLSRYFDYEAFGRVLFMYDYSMGANNHVFRSI
ncbi:MAG: antirestriction protein ArdA [Muribaculaceae bacterium]|nr:antirestriction protein ArdA [Muribaculaceae bacterium]